MTELYVCEGKLTGKTYKPGMVFEYQLAVPCAETAEYALLIEHDGQNDANVNAMLRLADEGKAPYCVSIGVRPGMLPMPDGTDRNMRNNNYDRFDREYADFLVYELIPYVEKRHRLSLSASPDMHFISGGSSGGISAFVVAWFHSEFFHRVYMSSPSFLAMGRGNEIPYLIRKYETKPLRVYEECSEKEPNDYFGWSRAIDEETREALTFAGYDFQYAFFAGEGHCSRYRSEEEAYRRCEWIWKDWKHKNVAVPGHSPRVSKVIPQDSRWEKCAAFPDALHDVPQQLPGRYRHAVLSNDGMAWYAGNPEEDVIDMIVKEGETAAASRIVHAYLHTLPGCCSRGALDLAVDRTDRLYVLTEMGIQCVRSYGLIDVILDLPQNCIPQKIAVTDALYLQTKDAVYRRPLCEECVVQGPEKRRQISYYD